jgi:translation initiation factor 3 subunit M
LAFYISRLRGESEDDAPYVKEIQALAQSDKDNVYTQLAKDVSILLTKNDRGKCMETSVNVLYLPAIVYFH